MESLFQNFHRLKAMFEALLKKDASFTWNLKLQKAFEEVKNILLGSLFLAHYDLKLTLIVVADASATGIESVLLQRALYNQTKAVFHISKSLTKSH